MANKETPSPPEVPHVRSSKKMFLLIGILVVVLALGGVGAMLVLKSKHKAPNSEVGAEETAEASTEPKKPPVFLNMEPFTVNLQSENGEQFLQVVASLKVSDEKTGEEVKAFMPQIRHEILSLLASKKASEITSPEGRESLATEMCETINEILGASPKKKKKKGHDTNSGPVAGVFFTQFIVQ